jgi:hypothetical protein
VFAAHVRTPGQKESNDEKNLGHAAINQIRKSNSDRTATHNRTYSSTGT